MHSREFLRYLESLNFYLVVEDGGLTLKGNKKVLSRSNIVAVTQNPEITAYIKTHKQELIDFLLHPDNSSMPPSGNIAAMYRLSALQQGILFHSLYEKGAGVYMNQTKINMDGLQPDVFIHCWELLMKRHTILRTGFNYDTFKIPVQCVYKQMAAPVIITDISNMQAEEQASIIKAQEEADLLNDFDLKNGPLFRIAALKCSETTYCVIWTTHHLILDGWSLPILVKEFMETYDALVEGKEPAVDEDRYEDYIRYTERIDRDLEKSYWTDYLKGVTEPTLLPFVDNRSAVTSGEETYEKETLYLNEQQVSRIQAFAHQQHITVNTLLQAVWAYQLHRYTGNDDIVYGVTVSGRPEDLPGMEQRVGMYINTLLLHTHLEGKLSVREWLQSLQQSQLGSREHQYVSLSDVRSWTSVEGELFDTLFIFQNFPVSEVLSEGKWHLRVGKVDVVEQGTNFPLCIRVLQRENITIQFIYKQKVISPAYAAMLCQHFEQVLHDMLEQPMAPLSGVRLMPAATLAAWVKDLQQEAEVNQPATTVVDLFEAQVLLTPDATAVVCGNDKLSYRELNERAGVLAAYLQQHGVGRESLVPVCMLPCIEMLVSIWGVLKAGAAYVPMDPGYPAERIGHIVEQCKATIVLTHSAVDILLPDGVSHVMVDGELPFAVPATRYAQPDHTAYVIYTSGSTGVPKGVMIAHQQLLNYLLNSKKRYMDEADETSSGSFIHLSFTFDAAVTALFVPLLTGKQVVISTGRSLEVFNDPAFLAHAPYDFIKLTPAHMYLLEPVLESCNGKQLANRLVLGGEALEPVHLRYLTTNNIPVEIINEYGPTECTVGCSTWHFFSGSGEELPSVVPIGRPLDHVQMYVLDGAGELCAPGVRGELYLGGAQLASGYLGQQQPTAKVFVPDHIHGGDGRLYRTGDIASWRPDGTMLFHGRTDDQLKIRGYRVEPGEIVAALECIPGVKQAVVLGADDGQGSKRLCAYVAITSDFDREATLQTLRATLPAYMVPDMLLELDQIPLTAHGKTDRQVLLAYDMKALRKSAYVAPRNELENKLVEIWQELLGVERIGIRDSFFDLGGHSLKSIQLLSAIRKHLGREMSIRDIFNHPTVETLAAQLTAGEQPVVASQLYVAERPEKLPLSFAQERLWFIDQLHGSMQYHMSWVFRLTGQLDTAALEDAFREIIQRHEILRTVIREEAGIGYQHIMSTDAWQMDYQEQETLSANGQSTEDYIQTLVMQPFSLSADYLLKISLIRLSTNEYMLVVLSHHIAFDGWSISIIVEELAALYRSRVERSIPVMKTLPVQYADYALWQRTYLSGELMDTKLDYWQKKLEGAAQPVLFPDQIRPAEPGIRGAFLERSLKPELLHKLESICREEGASMFMLLTAILKVLLYRYTGEEDITIGSPVAGRDRQELEGLIGFFINTLVLRNRVQGDAPFRQLLQEVKRTTLEAYEHQDVPFEKIVEVLNVKREIGHSPLFQVKLGLHNQPASGQLELGGCRLDTEQYGEKTVQIDISFDITTSEQGMFIGLTYCRDIYTAENMSGMIQHFVNLLNAVAAFPDTVVGRLPMLDAAEQGHLLEDFNAASVAYPRYRNIQEMFKEQVLQQPDAIAAKAVNGEVLSYRDLDTRSGKLAAYLKNKGVVPGALVGLCVHRSVEMIVNILAILKAGAAYLPLDPDYPHERLLYMVQDSGCRQILTHSDCRELLAGVAAQLLYTDTPGLLPEEQLTVDTAADQLAYVIYTSGSTGRPKGVMIEHRGVINLACNQREPLGLHPGIRVFQFASLSFDASCYEIFLTLLNGGELVISSKELLLDASRFAEVLCDEKIELITLPPSYHAVLDNGMIPIKTLVSAGEPLPAPAARRLEKQGIRVINAYGPTENTVCALLSVSPVYENGTVTIGRPVANVTAYILDEFLQPVPVGVNGELYLGGVQLSQGYLHRDDLTNEKFITHPFKAAERLYRTGDIARWLPDGNVVYEGRKDEQVKLRGFRIELGEIERVLLESGVVQQAAVVVREEENDKRLVAYVVAGKDFDKEEVRHYLSEMLPEYMQPSVLVTLEALPLTPSGKVDRKMLVGMEVTADRTAVYAAPRNELETSLCSIYEELLDVARVGIHDDFFELGGHSLLVIQLMSAIRKRLGKELTIREVFDNPTISALVALWPENVDRAMLPAITRYERPALIPLSFAQERLWFIDKLHGSLQYHMPTVFRINGALNIPALETAFCNIIRRHEVLRTVIREEEGAGYQLILDAAGWQMQQVYVSELERAGIRMDEYIDELVTTPFDLANDYILRVTLIKTSEDDHTLVIMTHHIAFDGWSAGVLIDELKRMYHSLLAHTPAIQEELPVQYADYAIWQRNYLKEVLPQKLDYWQQQLKEVAPLEFYTHRLRPATPAVFGGRVMSVLGPDLSGKLEAICVREGVTQFMLLLAAFKAVLYRYTGQEDICIGTPVAGRHQHELEGMIGFFVNMLALRTHVYGNTTFVELLQTVKQTTLSAYEHEEVPFEKIVEMLDLPRDMNRNPIFQILFTFDHLQENDQLEIGSAGLTNVQPGNSLTTRFEMQFTAAVSAQEIQLGIIYDKELYDDTIMRQLLDHYVELLQLVAADNNDRIAMLPLLRQEERNNLLQTFNDTATAYPVDKTLVDLFEDSVARIPEAIAVVFEDTRLTYRQLNEKADRLANHLRALGVETETLVPICTDRSPEMIIAILGILKAGAAYVPVDPAYPVARISYILNDTKAFVAVGAIAYYSLLTGNTRTAIRFVALDEETSWLPAQPVHKMVSGLQPSNAAYVIYTSGSTGHPKGVVNEHRGVVNRLQWAQQYFGLTAQDAVLQKTTYCFDVSVWELLWPLTAGARLVFALPDGHKDTAYLTRIIQAADITTIHFVPSMLAIFLEDPEVSNCTSLKRILCSGEALQPVHIHLLKKKLPEVPLYNLYGPTEAAIDVSCWKVPSYFNGETVSIGRPVANTQLYILDKEGHPAMPGMPGELYIGGVQVARGYLNMPEKTAASFVRDHISGRVEARLYRTGDLGCWQPDGNMIYLGRTDDQVKIRGYRIEPGEVAAVLQQAPGVKQAVVVPRENLRGEKLLAAYVVLHDGGDKQGILPFAAAQLPDYMLPGTITVLEAIPVNANGKVDKSRLPDIAQNVLESYEGPRNETEVLLVDIWKELLDRERIGIHDNFFGLGGHSLLAMRMVFAIQKKLDTEIPVKILFQFPDILSLARYIQVKQHSDYIDANDYNIIRL